MAKNNTNKSSDCVSIFKNRIGRFLTRTSSSSCNLIASVYILFSSNILPSLMLTMVVHVNTDLNYVLPLKFIYNINYYGVRCIKTIDLQC